MNLSRALQILATTWCFREFSPIRKKGPPIVQAFDNLRPISVASELAAVHDGLFLLRQSAKLISFWGPAQSGGLHEALASVLAIILLCQFRMAFGLALFIFFADLRFAFDVSSHDSMKKAAFEAGVIGRAWMCLDDLLSTDHSRIRLGDLTSHVFSLGDGAAQGRKISVHIVNGLMRYLHNYITKRSRGVGFWVTRWARRVLELAYSLTPSFFDSYCPASVDRTGAALHHHFDDESFAATILTTLSSAANRAGALDELAEFAFIASQYVDDLAAPASSIAQLCEVARACEEFTADHGPHFNVGPSKTAVLPIGFSPRQEDESSVTLMSEVVPFVAPPFTLAPFLTSS